MVDKKFFFFFSNDQNVKFKLYFLGQFKMVKLLIHEGANVNHSDLDGFTPLILASTKGMFKYFPISKIKFSFKLKYLYIQNPIKETLKLSNISSNKERMLIIKMKITKMHFTMPNILVI